MTFRYSILTLMLSGLIGCASNGDLTYNEQADTNRGDVIAQLVERVEQTNLASDQQELNQLTDLVDMPELRRFLDEAFANNPSLQQSLIALKIAYAQQGVSAADQLPNVNATFSGQNGEDSNESYNADLTVSWELDLWQRLADTTAASALDVAATQASFDSAQNLLAANIMRGWLEVSVNQQLLDIEQRRLAILANNETLVLERYQVGLGTLEELDNAKTSSATTRATVAQYQENLAQSQRNLLLLTGELSVDPQSLSISNQFPEVLNPLESMSVQNLSGRPDLRQAFYNIEANSLRTDVAYKAMLPSFSLSAS